MRRLVDQHLIHWLCWVESYSTWFLIFLSHKWGHWDDVSFLEAFLVDNILTERKINMRYIIFWHMKSCSSSEESVLLYGMFITKIVKFFNVNLWRETYGKKLKSFDTCNRVSLRQLQFVCKKDGSSGKNSFVPSPDVVVSSDKGSSKNATKIPPNNEAWATDVVDHPFERARNMAKVSDNLNVEIRSIATHLEEMALANDG